MVAGAQFQGQIKRKFLYHKNGITRLWWHFPSKAADSGKDSNLHGRRSPWTGFVREEAFKDFRSTSLTSRIGGRKGGRSPCLSFEEDFFSFAICSEVDILV